MATYEIPLDARPQRFYIQLAGISYELTFKFADAPDGGWIMDLADVDGNLLVGSIPLVTGHDLLEQYAYLGIGGQLFIQTDGDPDAVPMFANLGGESKLFFVTP